MYHGEIGAFRKFKSYAYQSEWRILVEPTSNEIFWLEIAGGIADISLLVSVDEINESLKFSAPKSRDLMAARE